MASDPLGALFERYRSAGDLSALARVFEVAGPELLALARHLRPRGQAPEDLVQSTFLAAVTHKDGFDARRPLRPWLFGILLNKAAAGRRPEVELEGDVTARESPEDEAAAAESARMLARGLERLPRIYREVLREHFFGGLPPRDIAQRFGRPTGTVRAQLHRGLRLLRDLLPAGLAGWLAWLGPSRASLVRVRKNVLERAADELGELAAGSQPGLPPLAGARLAGVGAFVVAGVLGLRAWNARAPAALLPDRTETRLSTDATAALRPASPERELRDASIAAPMAPRADAATHGELLVRVRFPDGSPASCVGLRVHAWGEPSWRDNRTDGVTDAAGELALEQIHAGSVGIWCDRGGEQGFGAAVTAGTRTVREIELPAGVNVSGEVVDARGAPVPHAGIWLSESPQPGFGRIALECDELGRFHMREVSPWRFLGARAAGHAPSEVEWLASGGVREGAAVALRLVLPDAAGSVVGRVVDARGAPLAGAQVELRCSASSGGRDARMRPDGVLLGPRTPLAATTDARGRFAFADLALEDFELVARAVGQPEHVASARLSATTPQADVELRLPEGGSVRGTVRFPDGEPALGAVVLAKSGALPSVDSAVDEQAAFVIEALAPGKLELQAGFGHAGGGELSHATFWLEPGGEARWDAVVERPQGYSGRLIDARGEPLAGAWLRAVPLGRERAELPAADVLALSMLRYGDLAVWLLEYPDRVLERQLEQVATDAQGAFTLPGIAAHFMVEVRLPDQRAGWPVQVFDPPPSDGALALASDAVHSAGITGTVAGPDGAALARGEVYAVRREGGEAKRRLDTAGAFVFETLPPGTFDVLVWARGHPPRVVATLTLAAGEPRDLGWLRLAP